MGIVHSVFIAALSLNVLYGSNGAEAPFYLMDQNCTSVLLEKVNRFYGLAVGTLATA